MSRVSPLVSLVLLAGCLGLGYKIYHDELELTRLRAEEMESASNTRRIAELQRELDAARSELDAAPRVAGAAEAQPVSGAPSLPPPSTSVRQIHMADLLRDHPEYASLMMKAQRRGILRNYGAALSQLNLSPDQLEKFKSLLTEQQLSASDAQQSATQAGLKPGTKEWNDAMAEVNNSLQQEIVSVVGQDNVDKFHALTAANGQIQTYFDPALQDAGVPLTSDQSGALARVIADNNNAALNPDVKNPNYTKPDPSTWLSPSDNQMLLQASQVLTPAQVQALRTNLTEENQRRAMYQSLSAGGAYRIVP
jgi:hypothetical protein